MKKKTYSIPERCLAEKRLKENAEFRVEKEIARIDFESNNEPWTRTTGAYHPSSLSPGACLRALWYDRTGEQPESNIPSDLRMLFDIGHALHDMVQSKLEKEFDDFVSEVSVKHEALHLVGHCDGVFREKDWVLEIKTVGESVYKNLIRPKKEHVYQVHCYMFALDIPRTQLLYLNRANGNMKQFIVDFDNEVFTEIANLIKSVEVFVEKNETPPPQPNKWVCRSCKFQHVCKPVFD